MKKKADNLVDLLRLRADEQADKTAFVFLKDGEEEGGRFTYSELDIRAKSIAAKLQNSCKQGERALLIYESGLEYLDSFFGCLYSGIISVPLHPPGKNKSLSRISAIAKDSGAKIILSTNEIYDELKSEFATDKVLKNLEWITTENFPNEIAEKWLTPDIKPETLAYLQYTSGSTGIPKGVMVNHRNLLVNLEIIDRSHPHNDNSVMVTWLPIHHDMGLIYGILLPFYCGYPCYFMTPQAFVQKPYRWLSAVSKYRGTHNAAPNFAFELCVNKISEDQKKTLDLSSWTTAMNAAEPVRAETIEKFSEYFSECGFKKKYFSPGYGLAEGTLILSTNFTQDEPVLKRFDDKEIEKNNTAIPADIKDTISKIHAGHSHSIEDTRIAIVNPVTLIECKEGEVGEVWASGSSVAQGYWKREDATKETFRAHIADTKEGPFLRTGDLGFIFENELYITGRHKDLIIIRGQNHYPQDIEYTVESSHPALRLGCVAAFSLDYDGDEHLGIVQEVQKNFLNDFDPEEVIKSIRKSVSEEHDLQVQSITLIKPGTVPKTSSGKIQRKACLQGVLSGELEIIAEWKNGIINDYRKNVIKGNKSESKPETISENNKSKFIPDIKNLKQWLVKRLSEMMQINPESIDVSESFAAYGMDSLKAVQLSGELETLLDRHLPDTLVYDYPNINSLSGFLISENPVSISHDSKIESAAENEPIAIVGIGLKFPGADSPDEFWKLLKEKRDAIREIPSGRWNENSLYPSTVKYGGFIDDTDKFDPVFFGISPREAVQTDPQQRLALEVAWKAFEDAGMDISTLAGSDTGVFLGICTYDYARYSSGRKELFDVYTGTGTSLSIAANRISYLFDFRGPSIAIDTACSSSLVALHTACKSIRLGECKTAIAGGVNLLLAPDWNVVFTEADMLAPDGKCKTFDAAADGYVRSEGCGIVVLKKLSEAIKSGDRIYSVIKGSAINQDGKSNGLTAPNGPSQEDVIRKALKNAGVSSDEISYIETHGTGTPLGDPIEVNSIVKVISKDRSPENECYIGSVKTNIGHLEAAAGIAGVIKTSLALYHKEIPGHLNFSSLNPEIHTEGTAVKISSAEKDWSAAKRYAGVSSFGFGGTNAHVILENAPLEIKAVSKKMPLNIFTLSAKNEKSLMETAGKYLETIAENNFNIEDICYTSSAGRASFNHRLAIVCKDNSDLTAKLTDFISGKNSNGIYKGTVKTNHIPKTAFLFPGQGAQFIGMGKELYDTQPLFRKIINRCDEILRDYLLMPLTEVLFYEKDEKLNPINETTYTQPALFAIEYALGMLWKSWGVRPDIMMGHSAGEVVAACLAGVFSLEDGLKLAAERGRLMQTMTEEGEMYTVFADEKTTREFLKGYENDVSIASINGPEKTVISGGKESLLKIIPLIESKNIEYKKIIVSIASHSPLMNSMIDEFRKVCATIKYSESQIPVVSNISGEIVTDKIANAEYWCNHILSPVRFSESIKECVNYGVEIFIDLGPKPTSINMGQETVRDTGIKWLPSFKYNFTIRETMLGSLGNLFVSGAEPDWKGFWDGIGHGIVSLPGYSFQRERYWVGDGEGKTDLSVFRRNAETGSGDGNFKGHRLQTASENEIIYKICISGNSPEYLKDHIVFDNVILPGAAFVESVLAAFRSFHPGIEFNISDLKFHHALILEENKFKNIQIIFYKENKSDYKFKIFSSDVSDNEFDEVSWIMNSSGSINSVFLNTETLAFEKVRNSFINEFDRKNEMNQRIRDFYENVKAAGVEYRNSFRGIKELYIKEKKALSFIELDTSIKNNNYIHPALLDNAFQTALSLLVSDKKDCAFIPAGINNIRVLKKLPDTVYCAAKFSENSFLESVSSADIDIYSASGEMLISITGLQLKEISRQDFLAMNDDLKDWFYYTNWEKTADQNLNLLHSDISGIVKKISENTLQSDKVSDYKKFVNSLGELSAQFILTAYNKSDAELTVSAKFNQDDLFKKSGFLKKYSKLILRFREILENKGLLKNENESLIFSEVPDLRSIDKNIKELYKKYPEHSAEIKLTEKCGKQLLEILTGKKDPLDILFPEGDMTLLTKLYQDSPAFSLMNNLIKQIVYEIAEGFYSANKLKILEIGAGTGSTLNQLLPLLREKSIEFYFTDISPAFFMKAKTKFKEFENIEYKVLDIEKDPVPQGFGSNEYDIIIASNVIHATKDLTGSLENIKKLLTPDGIFILNEVTEKQSWIDITFGLTDGWWRFSDTELRESYPLLNVSDWKKLLLNSGFKSVESIPGDEINNMFTGQTVFTAALNKEDVSVSASGSELLIFSNNKLNKNLKSAFKKSASVSAVIGNGNSFNRTEENEFTIDFRNSLHIKDLLKAVSGKKKEVVYITEETESINSDKIDEINSLSISLILNLIKINYDADNNFIESITILTGGSISANINDKVNGLINSPLWGLQKVISLEHPDLKVRIIDIDKYSSLDHIVKEIISGKRNDITAIRANNVYEPVLKRLRNSGSEKTEITKNGVYIITGGLSGIGLLTAKWLSEKGAAHIALISRRDNYETAESILSEIKSSGTEVKIYKGDVSIKEDLENIFKEINSCKYPVKGIIHSAGLLDDGILLNQTSGKFLNVFSPKVNGAWNLHELTKESELDFFIMYSSVASLFGSSGQANHSAANAFLDSLSFYRKSRGLPALSINWGVWSEVGSAADKGADKTEKIQGLGLIDPKRGIRALESIIGTERSQIGIFPMDWVKFTGKYKNSFTKYFGVSESKQTIETDIMSGDNFIERLEAANDEEQTELLINYFKEVISNIMGLDTSDLDNEQPLNTLGLDSLMAIELKNKVNMELGVDLNLVRYMEETGIIHLAAELKEQLPKIISSTVRETVKTVSDFSEEEKARDLLSNLDNLSEDELDRLLNESK
ncbi:MAG TPA: SDR family NAD(P)-dependent oxidoreductase [Ignavibacteria bacterium]|nr:SDR family NAD(P)-dependent oxidoreductase [Ignavibacteria bacterium]HRK00428.1 SDR family NAD(P)-dependent oxidoreductase [Ignavibacteria bacterium]